jgi:hypothetical protein
LEEKKHYLLIFLLHIWLNNLNFISAENTYIFFIYYVFCHSLDSTAWAGAPLTPPPTTPSLQLCPNDTTVICSYTLERNIAKNTHMTHTIDNRTYSIVLM